MAFNQPTASPIATHYVENRFKYQKHVNRYSFLVLY